METKKRILSFQGIRLFAFIVIFLSHSRLSSKVNGGGGGNAFLCFVRVFNSISLYKPSGRTKRKKSNHFYHFSY